MSDIQAGERTCFGEKLRAGVGVAVAVLLTSFVTTVARAGDSAFHWPTPSVAGVNLDVTDDDVTALSKALIFESGPGNGTLIILMQPCDKMPAFDPVFHYAGIGSLPDHPAAPVVVGCDSKSASQDEIEHALGRAILLAVMDDGEAGPKMKSLFDAANAKDSALPAGSADPYLNRHALADAFSFLLVKPK